MVCFGNFLDSSGSVVPLFREQLLVDEPITVAHPEITRYLMAISAAAYFVTSAAAITKGRD